MRKGVRQSAFSLLEMVVVVATILILAGALLGVGKYMKVRAEVDLVNSELEVLTTALQLYYDDWDTFPFDTDTDVPEDGIADYYLTVDLETDIGGTISSGAFEDAYASSSALFYFLNKNPNSRKIIEALIDTLVTNKDADGVAIQLTLTATSETINLPRFIDVWGTSIRYEYLPDTAFPILTSAGPDTIFYTADDIKS